MGSGFNLLMQKQLIWDVEGEAWTPAGLRVQFDFGIMCSVFLAAAVINLLWCICSVSLCSGASLAFSSTEIR